MRNQKKRNSKYGAATATATATVGNLAPPTLPQHQQLLYEGESLVDHLLQSIKRNIEIESATLSNPGHKFWLKHQFSIGVNEVTRVLERMGSSRHHTCAVNRGSCSGHCSCRASSSVQLQAILLACDCNTPRWLTKHLPGLASVRKVPLIYVKDKKGGCSSVRLGDVVNLKTAIAVGVKARGNAINQLTEEILRDDI